MADNTPQDGTAVIAADDIGGVLHQRTKVGFGVDGEYTDVSLTSPLPVSGFDTGTTGTITARDLASATATSTPVAGQGTFSSYSGTPTAGSTVALDVRAASAWVVQVTGTWVGTLQFERTYDGVNWHSVLAQVSGTSGVFKTVTANCAAHGNTAAALNIRVRATAWTSGTATIVLRESEATGSVSLLSSMRIADGTTPAVVARVDALGNLQVNNNGGSQTTGTASGNIFTARSATVGTTSAVLQAAPAAGLSIYITDVSVSNSGSTLSTVQLLPTAGTPFLDITAAATGGGGSMNFQTPVKLAAATGLSVIATAASTTLYVTVTGYIAP